MKGYCAFLDIEKAYDRVDRVILFEILRKVGLGMKVVNIIRSMYENTRAIYRLGDLETRLVRSVRGVRQGCTLSPTLFGLYTEELAWRIRRSGLGMRVGNDRLSCLLYADDIVLISESAEELQEMLDLVAGYGRDFDVKFSSEKSKVIVINGDVDDIDRLWQIGNIVIERTNEYKYLGCMLNENGCERAKAEKLFKAHQWSGRLGSVARFRANKYECIRGLWKGVGVPAIMYGIEVMRWT